MGFKCGPPLWNPKIHRCRKTLKSIKPIPLWKWKQTVMTGPPHHGSPMFTRQLPWRCWRWDFCRVVIFHRRSSCPRCLLDGKKWKETNHELFGGLLFILRIYNLHQFTEHDLGFIAKQFEGILNGIIANQLGMVFWVFQKIWYIPNLGILTNNVMNHGI